jgi:predicted transcriptional regulator
MHIPTPAEIKAKRIKSGLKQSDIAKKAGISQSMVARIEAGTVDPRVSTLSKIIEVLLEAERSKVTAGRIMTAPVISARPDQSIAEVVEIMRANSISQLPIIHNGLPVGCISESAIVDALEDGRLDRTKEAWVRDFMGSGMPTLPSSTDLDSIVHILRNDHSILVMDEGKVVGVITKHDLIGMVR